MMLVCILVQELAYLRTLFANSAVCFQAGETWLDAPARLSSSLLRGGSSHLLSTTTGCSRSDVGHAKSDRGQTERGYEAV
jgi:hypothetical protein